MNSNTGDGARLSRRGVLRTGAHAAWVVPAVQVVAAAPAFATTPDEPDPVPDARISGGLVSAPEHEQYLVVDGVDFEYAGTTHRVEPGTPVRLVLSRGAAAWAFVGVEGAMDDVSASTSPDLATFVFPLPTLDEAQTMSRPLGDIRLLTDAEPTLRDLTLSLFHAGTGQLLSATYVRSSGEIVSD